MRGGTEGLLVVANARAGGTRDDAVEQALEVLRAERPVEVAYTSSPEDLAGVLDRRGDRWLVVVGGDGSLHAVVAALHRRGELGRAVLGLVPLGTGNDLARTLGVALDPAAAARQLLAGRPARLDLLVDDRGDVAVNAVNIGIGAAAARDARPFKGVLGALGYAVGAVRAGLRERGWRLDVTTDDGALTQGAPTVLHLIIGNGATVGGGAPVAPGADPGDGRVDVMVSRAVGRVQRLAYALRLRRGEHVDRGDVTTARAREVGWSAQRPVPYAVDGELRPPRREVRWHVEPGAWQLVRSRDG